MLITGDSRAITEALSFLAIVHTASIARSSSGSGRASTGSTTASDETDLIRKNLQLGDQMSRSQMAEERLVGLGVRIGALDEDRVEDAGCDFGRGVRPDAGGAWK